MFDQHDSVPSEGVLLTLGYLGFFILYHPSQKIRGAVYGLICKKYYAEFSDKGLWEKTNLLLSQWHVMN